MNNKKPIINFGTHNGKCWDSVPTHFLLYVCNNYRTFSPRNVLLANAEIRSRFVDEICLVQCDVGKMYKGCRWDEIPFGYLNWIILNTSFKGNVVDIAKYYLHKDKRASYLKSRLDKEKTSLLDYPVELRGLPTNRYGGHQSRRLKTYPGKFGPANPGRSLSDDEKEEWQSQNADILAKLTPRKR